MWDCRRIENSLKYWKLCSAIVCVLYNCYAIKAHDALFYLRHFKGLPLNSELKWIRKGVTANNLMPETKIN